MGETSSNDLAGTFLIQGGHPTIWTAQTDLSVLVCGNTYFQDLQNELTNLVAGDLVYISGWGIDSALVLDSTANTDTLFVQLAKLAQINVDVRVILWELFPANFATSCGINSSLADCITQATEGLAVAVTHGALVGTNWRNAVALRKQTVASTGTPPMQGRVMLDYSGFGYGVTAQHQKAVVIQSKSNTRLIAYVGGIDLMSNRASDPNAPSWQDVIMKLSGGAAYAVFNDISERWQEAQRLVSISGQLFDPMLGSLGSTQPVNEPGTINTWTTQPANYNGAFTTASKDATIEIVRSFPPFRQWSYPSPLSPALPSPQKIPWSAFELQTGGLTEVKTVLTNAIRAAQNFIYIEDQIFFRGNATNSLIWGTSILFPLLVSAAVNRVKVIILGSGNAEDGTAPTVWSASDWLNSALITPAYSAATEGAPSISVNALTGAFVHAKVVIVDDTFAMVGSANFADRSMGSTDVEMSVAMVSPPGTVPVPPASPLSTGSIVQDLRITLWAYHFGFDVENPDSWNAIADTSQSFGLWNTSWSQNPLQPPKPGDKTWKHNSLVQQFPVPITEGGS